MIHIRVCQDETKKPFVRIICFQICNRVGKFIVTFKSRVVDVDHGKITGREIDNATASFSDIQKMASNHLLEGKQTSQSASRIFAIERIGSSLATTVNNL